MASLANCLARASSIIAQDDIDTIAGAHDFLTRDGMPDQQAAQEAVQAVIDSAQQDLDQLTSQIDKVGGAPLQARGGGAGIFKARTDFQAPTDVNELGQAAKEYVLNIGKTLDKEALVIADEKGKVVAAGSGRKGSVMIDPSTGFLSPSSHLAAHHNHPTNQSLSDADISVLGASGMDVIWAHTPDGHSFRASLRASIKAQIVARNRSLALDLYQGMKILKKTAVAMNRVWLPIFRNAIYNQDIPYDVALEMYDHAVNVAWMRAGVIDYYASRGYGKLGITDAGFEAITDAIEGMTNAAIRSLKRNGIDAVRLPINRSPQPDIRHVADVGGISGGGQRAAAGPPAAPAPDRGRPGDDQPAAARGPSGTAPSLKQPGLRYIKNPLELGVPLPRGQKKRKIVDIGKAFDAAHLAEHGRPFFPETSEEDYQRLLTDAATELRDQRLQDNSGEGWYDEDVKVAMELASLAYPTLAPFPSNTGIPFHRDVFLMFAGIFSNGNEPEAAFLMSAEAFEAFLKNGQIPVRRSVAARVRGKRPQRSQYKKAGEDVDALTGWSNRNDVNEKQLNLVRWLSAREGSVENAIKWLQSAQPLTAINAAMIGSGYKAGRFGVREAAAATVKVPGAIAFGDKLGRYTLTLQGQPMETDEAAVIDMWYIRTYRRHIGRLLEQPGDQGVVGGPTETDRDVVFRMTADLARMHNMRQEDVQAVLWFYEKRLWAAVGIDTSEGTNSSGARKLLDSKGIPIPATDRQGDDRTGGVEPGAERPPQGPAEQAPGQAPYRPRLEGLGRKPRGGTLRSTDVGALVPAPPFYSAVTRAIENTPPEMKMTSPLRWMAIIRGAQDVKKEEIDLLGLQEFLANPPPAYGPNPKGSLQSRGYTLERLPDDEGYPNPNGEMAWQVYGPDDGGPWSSIPVVEELDGRTEEEAWANAEKSVASMEIAPDAPEIKGKVTKEALLEFVRENEITVEEVVKGETQNRFEELQGREEALVRDQTRILQQQNRLLGRSPAEMDLDQQAVDNLFDAGERRLSEIKQELHAIALEWDTLHNNQSTHQNVRHPGHVQPGGKKYTELLLTMPSPTIGGVNKEIKWREQFFDPNHWEEPDVIVWARFDERDGTMYVHEVQSQLHQMGRETGYKTPGRGETQINDDINSVMKELEDREPGLSGKQQLSYDAWERYWNRHPELKQQYSDLIKELGDVRRKVPDTPFKQTWPELIMKRLIRYAAEKGFKRIAWTPGDVQNERWRLSNQVDEIRYFPPGSRYPRGNLQASREGHTVVDRGVDPEELPGLIGKELTEKLLASATSAEFRRAGGGSRMYHSLSGLDLEIGGKGMRDFYDKRLVDIANKIGRRVGVQVEMIDMEFAPERLSRRIGESAKTQPQRTASLEITPSLREMAMKKGFPRFMWTSPAGKAKAAAQIEVVGARLDALADKILGHRIKVELFTKAWKDSPGAMAAFFANRHGGETPVIAINLASTPEEHRPGALRHEAVHALRDWGVFTKPEWAILVRAAKMVMDMDVLYRDYAYYRDEAENLTEARFKEMVEEEAVAELFRYWGNGALPGDTKIPVLRTIEKIGKFIGKMVDLVQNLLLSRSTMDIRDSLSAFKDAQQIMGEIEAGKFKERPTGYRERPSEIKAKKGSGASVGEMKQGALPRAMQLHAPVDEDELTQKLAGNINLNYLNTDEDIDSILTTIADLHEKFISARRGVQSHAETARLAKSMGLKEETLLKRQKGETWSAHRIYAARTLLVKSARKLKEAIGQAIKTESVEDLARFQQAYTRHVAIMEQIAGLASEAGRALNQFKMMAGDFDFKAAKNLVDTATARQFAAMGSHLTGREALMHLLRMTADMPNDSALNTFTRKAYKATVWDMIREAYINSLLSGIGTQVINFVGTAATTHLQIIEAMNTAIVGNIRRAAGDRRERVTWGEVGARLAGMIHGYGEGAVAAGKVFWTTEQTYGKHRQMEQGKRQAIPGKIGKLVRAPTERVMAASDEFFKGINFHAELAALAYRQAYVEEGLRGGAMRDRVKELRTDPPEDMIDAAVHYADYQTFQNNLGHIAGAAMRLREDVPVIGWLALPFMKTPVNLFKYIQERSPVISMGHREGRLDLLGKNGKIAQDSAVAKLMTGSGLIYLAIGLLGAGLLTGGGSDDPEERERDIADGWQPYSARFPGSRTWISYQRGDPFAILVGVVADMYENSDKLDETDLEKLPAKLIWAAFNTVMSKTWARGPSDLIEAIGSRDEKQLDRYLHSLFSSPIPTMSAQIARTMDPTLRDARTFMDSIMSRVPGQKHVLPPRRDIWGEERRYEQLSTGLGEWADFALNLANPIYTSTMKRDPIIHMMREIGYAPERPAKKINDHELTAEQYSEFSQLIGNRAKELSTRRVGFLKPIKTREERFGDIWTAARKYAVGQMKQRYPEMKRPPLLPDVELPYVPEWSITE